MTRTLATIKPKRGRHNDVEQIQVRELIKAGFGGPKPEQQVLHVREEQGE